MIRKASAEQHPHYDSTARKPQERVLHALLFEIIAIILSTPLFAFIMGRDLLEMGALTTMVAIIAVIWNYLYNLLFDRLTRSFITKRTFRVRLIHAVIFELGLILVTVPLTAVWLKITLLQALYLDIGILLFFLPYTVLFNWCYDAIRYRLWLRFRAEREL